jgi:hypothetical protein
MKYKHLIGVMLVEILFVSAIFAQQTVVINDPTVKYDPVKPITANAELIEREVLPKARKHWAGNDACTEQFEIKSEAIGAFSKPKANQKLVLYEFCQTGNGFGNNGLVLFEGGKIIGSYVSEGGWAIDLESLPDINQNGLNEFLVYYSGGMHQGMGGTGVDLMEFSASGIKGLGWFQSDSYGEETGDWSYKVSVKTGKTPLFYREKYISKNDKLQKSGKITPFKLGAAVGKFTALK